MDCQLLTDEMKSLALELGADLIGIASADRYAEAPIEMSPEGHLPGATSVLVIAIHHPDAAVEVAGDEHPQKYGPYAIQGTMNTKLECISFQLARRLEDAGFSVVAIPATNVWRFRPYKNVKESFAPDLSNIHAAAAAGLGEIGYSGLLLTPEFGPRQRLCCLITDAPLVADALYEGPALCDMCGECVRHCPTDAFTKETSGKHVISIQGKQFSYSNKNKWRCAWAEHFGLDLDAQIPEVVDERAILRGLEVAGRRGGAMGPCLRYCLPPHLRLSDPGYCTTYRRRKPYMDERPLSERIQDPPPPIPDRIATDYIVSSLMRGDADMVTTVDRATCLERGFDLRTGLPDAESLIVFAYHYPEILQQPDSTAEKPTPLEPVGATLAEWSGFAQLDLCRHLERLGYSAMPGLHLPTQQVALASGLVKGLNAEGRPMGGQLDARLIFGSLLTSAALQPTTRIYAEVPMTDAPRNEELRSALEHEAFGWGADLFGVACPDTVSELAGSYCRQIDETQMRWSVRDIGGYHGPVKPVIEHDEQGGIRTVDQVLPGAKSVVVIGYHFPFANLERAAEPPADAVGPYSYAVYQTHRWLRHMGLSLTRVLHRFGYRAVMSQDLCGSGTVVANPRGAQPDALANRFAAVAAGMGHLGLHGAVITPEYGTTQRFIAIATDADLPCDAPLLSETPCARCGAPCMAACPVNALSRDTIQVSSDGCSAKMAVWDRLRCEWAKRYALVGEEGPRFCGQSTDIAPLQGEITPEQVALAYEQKDPIQKHFTSILEPCLKACHVWWMNQEP